MSRFKQMTGRNPEVKPDDSHFAPPQGGQEIAAGGLIQFTRPKPWLNSAQLNAPELHRCQPIQNIPEVRNRPASGRRQWLNGRGKFNDRKMARAVRHMGRLIAGVDHAKREQTPGDTMHACPTPANR